MTSEVMVLRRTGAHTRAMKRSTVFLLLILLSFTAVTAHVMIAEGPLGFIAAHESAWGLQVFLDLVIALTLFLAWMVPDARRHGLPAWLFVTATLLLGSIGALGYLVVRSLVPPRG